MLGTLLRLLERDPRQDVQPAILDDPEQQRIFRQLVHLGALRRSRRASEVLCPSCMAQRVSPYADVAGEEWVGCIECGTLRLPFGYTAVFAVDVTWLTAQISRSLPGSSTFGSEPLEPNLLWRVARLPWRHKTMDVLFARIPGQPETEDRLARCLLDQPAEIRQLVFLSQRAPIGRWCQTAQRQLVALEDHAYLDESGLHLDGIPLLDRLCLDATKPLARVEAAPDGSWLRVNGRELRVRQSRQRDFVLVMVDSYLKGSRRPKLEWVLRQAGYSEGTSELKHISKRPEFFQFFGHGNGEVWIRDGDAPSC